MKPLLLRSSLYMPAVNVRALEKAHSLDIDAIIADLEDGVALIKKNEARKIVADAFSENYGFRLKVLRINGPTTPYVDEDMHLAAKINPDALLLTKINTPDELNKTLKKLDAISHVSFPVWLMIETPSAVINIDKLAQNRRVKCLVMGTNDLGYALHSRHIPGRIPFLYSFSKVILAGRANGLAVLDGVYSNLQDLDGFKNYCNQGRNLGFDGVTLIHPSQVAIANEEYSVSIHEIEWAHKVCKAWDEAQRKGQGVATVEGWFIENLHVDEAKRLLGLETSIRKRTSGKI